MTRGPRARLLAGLAAGATAIATVTSTAILTPVAEAAGLAPTGARSTTFAAQSAAEPVVVAVIGPIAPGEPTDADFDRLARCESSSRWALNSGNDYYGGLQFDAGTWHSVGGTGLPHEHTRQTQIELGRRLWRQRGWSPWPSCSRTMGLR